MIYRIIIDIQTDKPEAGIKAIVDDPTTWIPIVRSWSTKGIDVDRIALIWKVDANQSRSDRRRMIKMLRA